jgi:serine/threonine-protein kinase
MRRLGKSLLYVGAAAFGAAVAVVLVNFVMMPLVVGHGRDVEVPGLVGVSVERAEKLAADIGLKLFVEEEVFDDDAGRNRIVRQKPGPGSSAKQGSRIRVAVSAGLEAVGTPYLVGLLERQAELALSRAGLRMGTVSRRGGPSDGTAVVLVQSPSPGAVLSKSSSVNLIVGAEKPEGNIYVMPLLEGLPTSEVTKALLESGFSVRVEGREGGVVSMQLPLAGSMISRDETIVLKSRLSGRGVRW